MNRARIGMAIGLALLAAACAGGGPVADIKPGERPTLETDEAGLWMMMDRVEGNLRTSGRLERDSELNAYVREILCRIAAEYCADIRLYIVRSPGFNASMAPNGTMLVWTGFLLRTQNEAQLAHVLGHEVAHYLRRHSLQRWQDIRAKTDALVFFQVATAVVGVGFVGSLAQVATLGSIMAYSRDHEREADDLGFDLATKAGYAPAEAPKIWEMLIEEKNANEDDKPSMFFSSHPPSEERQKTLSEKAVQAGGPGAVDRDRYLAATERFRIEWLRHELQQRDLLRFEVVLNHLIASDISPGTSLFFLGELYRVRGEDGDIEMAIATYEEANALGTAPVEAYRALGLAHWSLEQTDPARAALERYLELAPGAHDRAMIEHYLTKL